MRCFWSRFAYGSREQFAKARLERNFVIFRWFLICYMHGSTSIHAEALRSTFDLMETVDNFVTYIWTVVPSAISALACTAIVFFNPSTIFSLCATQSLAP